MEPAAYLSSLTFQHFSCLTYVTLTLKDLTKSLGFSLPIALNNNFKSIRLLCCASGTLPCLHCAAHYMCSSFRLLVNEVSICNITEQLLISRQTRVINEMHRKCNNGFGLDWIWLMDFFGFNHWLHGFQPCWLCRGVLQKVIFSHVDIAVVCCREWSGGGWTAGAVQVAARLWPWLEGHRKRSHSWGPVLQTLYKRHQPIQHCQRVSLQCMVTWERRNICWFSKRQIFFVCLLFMVYFPKSSILFAPYAGSSP